MIEALLLCGMGVRSAKRTLSDGQEHTLYFKSKTPTDVAVFLGAERREDANKEGDIARERRRAEFIATSLCDEGGGLLLSVEKALMIPATLKPELCMMIVNGSGEIGEAGKG